jgi:uncharacterized protein (TIGR02391 family)
MSTALNEKQQAVLAKLLEQVQELTQLLRQSRSSQDAFEKLRRWKDRAGRIIAAQVSEVEARKFADKKIGLRNMAPDTNLARNIEEQEAYLSGLIEDIQKYPEEYFGDAVPTQAPGAPLDSTYESAIRLLHPAIVQHSVGRFRDGYYADAVETAMKTVNARVKAFYKSKTGEEKDGVDLMRKAFTLTRPIIVLDDLSTESGKSVQQGYMDIFAGSIAAVRNPKAHGVVNIDALRAMHFLFLASLEMHKLDEVDAES